MKKNIHYLFLVFLLLFVFLYFDGFKLFRNRDESTGSDGYLSLFSKVMDLVKTDYVEDVNPAQKFPGAFSSMVSGVDDYSSYLSEKKSRLFQKYQNERYFGCGVYGVKNEKYFSIVDIRPDSPAYKAGLRVGDIIRKANGTSFFELSFWEMFLSMISETPEPFSLVCMKKKSKSLQTLTIDPVLITGDIIFKKINHVIRLISLMRMDMNSVNRIKAEMTKNQKSKWIIDLRKYSGGNFEAFLEISKIFIHEIIPLSLETRNDKMEYLIGSDSDSMDRCVFIINASTTLYSELLAHFLKVSKALLIGETTTGFVPYLEQIYLDDGCSLVLNTGVFKIFNQAVLGRGVKPTVNITTADDTVLFSSCVDILGDSK